MSSPVNSRPPSPTDDRPISRTENRNSSMGGPDSDVNNQTSPADNPSSPTGEPGFDVHNTNFGVNNTNFDVCKPSSPASNTNFPVGGQASDVHNTNSGINNTNSDVCNTASGVCNSNLTAGNPNTPAGETALFGGGICSRPSSTDPQAMPRWEGRAVLLVDLDAFFASVEQLDHPEWRGRPVIVGNRGERGVVSTCSYEARAFGVHSAMPSATAQRMCPEGIWVEPRFGRYRELSAEVMGIMRDESPTLERMSVDEAYLDVTPGRFVGDDPVVIAGRIQERVAGLGVSCSVGVGANKTVSKIASDMDKPRGLVVVFPGTEAAFLAPLEVRVLGGIGPRSAEKLAGLGIRTLGQLAAADEESLRGIFGVNARDMRLRAAGVDEREVVVGREVKSVSHERTFERDLTERDDIIAGIDWVGSLVGRRLRREGLAGHTVTLKLRFSDLTRRTAQRTIDIQTDDEGVFLPIAHELLGEVWRPGEGVRLVGVAVSGFAARPVQLGLFDDAEGARGVGSRTEGGGAGSGSAEGEGRGDAAGGEGRGDAAGGGSAGGEERRELLAATDRVRDKFGEDAVAFGRELKGR